MKTARTVDETMVYCMICKENFHFVYFHRLIHIMHVEKKTTTYCVLRGVELEKV